MFSIGVVRKSPTEDVTADLRPEGRERRGPCQKCSRQEEQLVQRAGMGLVFSRKSKKLPVAIAA